MKNLTSFSNFANVCLRFLMWCHRAVQNRNFLFLLLLDIVCNSFIPSMFQLILSHPFWYWKIWFVSLGFSSRPLLANFPNRKGNLHEFLGTMDRQIWISQDFFLLPCTRVCSFVCPIWRSVSLLGNLYFPIKICSVFFLRFFAKSFSILPYIIAGICDHHSSFIFFGLVSIKTAA